MSLVRIGFFRDFKGADTLLIDGDSDGLRLLADRLRQLLENGEAVAIHDLPFVEKHHGLRVFAKRGQRDIGALIDGVNVTWQRSADGWEDVLAKLHPLLETKAGHQYLDANDDAITVEVSTGEYDGRWWTDNG
jgi:hypothetical protein